MGEGAECCHDGFLGGGGTPFDSGGGSLRAEAAGNQAREMSAHARRRHQDNQRAAPAGRACEIVPRNSVGGVFRGILMAGDKRHERTAIAMGQRNSREGRRGYCGGHAGHHFERDSCRGERLGLLAPAPEDEWVATLEAHDAAARAGVQGR